MSNSPTSTMLAGLESLLGRFTIKQKLLGVATLVSATLLVILYTAFTSFQSLDTGFAVILDEADQGMKNAEATVLSVSEVDNNLTKMSAEMTTLASDIQRTNQYV